MNTTTLEALAEIILKLVNLGPNVIQTADDARPFVDIIVSYIGGKKLTATEIIDMRAKLDALIDEFLAPLPPE